MLPSGHMQQEGTGHRTILEKTAGQSRVVFGFGVGEDSGNCIIISNNPQIKGYVIFTEYDYCSPKKGGVLWKVISQSDVIINS